MLAADRDGTGLRLIWVAFTGNYSSLATSGETGQAYSCDTKQGLTFESIDACAGLLPINAIPEKDYTD
jgi:hypothetical protein